MELTTAPLSKGKALVTARAPHLHGQGEPHPAARTATATGSNNREHILQHIVAGAVCVATPMPAAVLTSPDHGSALEAFELTRRRLSKTSKKQWAICLAPLLSKEVKRATLALNSVDTVGLSELKATAQCSSIKVIFADIPRIHLLLPGVTY
ncbi:hypothetical protein Y1Q_0009997 [Alligator mississippiensis]|uniref:Uncharacterized protein n=1 Tax=Alligator mississippiensis TaxID=8496 RepID=A0A151ML66_ALLMI|nr:hypothetical protein Y1Q_0009997 [Alligator mississippiensis]